MKQLRAQSDRGIGGMMRMGTAHRVERTSQGNGQHQNNHNDTHYHTQTQTHTHRHTHTDTHDVGHTCKDPAYSPGQANMQADAPSGAKQHKPVPLGGVASELTRMGSSAVEYRNVCIAQKQGCHKYS